MFRVLSRIRVIREILIYLFNLKNSAVEVHRLVLEAYGQAVLSGGSFNWFQVWRI